MIEGKCTTRTAERQNARAARLAGKPTSDRLPMAGWSEAPALPLSANVRESRLSKLPVRRERRFALSS